MKKKKATLLEGYVRYPTILIAKRPGEKKYKV